jgi:hypothetical protein
MRHNEETGRKHNGRRGYVDIRESFYKGSNRIYTILTDVTWNKEREKNIRRTSPIGKVEGGFFTPNRKVGWMVKRYGERPESLSAKETKLVELVMNTYRDRIALSEEEKEADEFPRKIIRCTSAELEEVKIDIKRIEVLLREAFGDEDGKKLMSLGWQTFMKRKPENIEPGLLDKIAPKHVKLGMQALDELANRIEVEGICDAYEKFKDNQWVDQLTDVDLVTKSIPCDLLPFPMGEGLEAEISLVRSRESGMPLASWPGSVNYLNMNGSQILRIAKELDLTPRCAMLGDEYANLSKISGIFNPGISFLQRINPNYAWVNEAIKHDWNFYKVSSVRLDGRIYFYGAESAFRWVYAISDPDKKDSSHLHAFANGPYVPREDETVLFEAPCYLHKPFCKEVAKSQRIPFLDRLHDEYEFLVNNPDEPPSDEFERFIIIENLQNGKRNIEFYEEAVDQQMKSIFGFICFITNDLNIFDTKSAMLDYSIREYVTRPFFEKKPENNAIYDEDRLLANTFVYLLSEMIYRFIDKPC